MAVKKNEKGRVIATYAFFTIRQVPKYTGYGKDRKEESSITALYVGKRQLKNNFINVDRALEYAKIIKPTYNRRKKSFVEPKEGNFFKGGVVKAKVR